MKTLKKSILILIFTLISTFNFSQSGWNSGNYYAYQGGTETQTSYNTVYDRFCRCYVNVTYCRQLSWYKEYRSGYVNYWGPNGWYTEYKEGYFWYCVWGNWYTCY